MFLLFQNIQCFPPIQDVPLKKNAANAWNCCPTPKNTCAMSAQWTSATRSQWLRVCFGHEKNGYLEIGVWKRKDWILNGKIYSAKLLQQFQPAREVCWSQTGMCHHSSERSVVLNDNFLWRPRFAHGWLYLAKFGESSC